MLRSTRARSGSSAAQRSTSLAFCASSHSMCGDNEASAWRIASLTISWSSAQHDPQRRGWRGPGPAGKVHAAWRGKHTPGAMLEARGRGRSDSVNFHASLAGWGMRLMALVGAALLVGCNLGSRPGHPAADRRGRPGAGKSSHCHTTGLSGPLSRKRRSPSLSVPWECRIPSAYISVRRRWRFERWSMTASSMKRVTRHRQ